METLFGEQCSDIEAPLACRFARKHNEYGFMQYAVPPMLYCHLTAAQPERPNVTWPKAQGEVARRQAVVTELARGWRGSLVPAVAQLHSRTSLLVVGTWGLGRVGAGGE